MFLGAISVLAQGNSFRDPFLPPFSHKQRTTVKPNVPEKSSYVENVSKERLDVTVEGIIISDYLKQAIIDGAVYKTGDTLKNKNAKVMRINKNSVSIAYNGVIYEEIVSKRKKETK